MLKAYRYRLYPDKNQSALINKHIGCCRFVYNHGLEVKEFAYLLDGRNVSCFELINHLKEFKEMFPWLYEVDSQALQQSIINLFNGYNLFFKGQAEPPKFKNKYNTQSFRNPHGSRVKIENGKLSQPKFAKQGIDIVIDRQFNGEIKSTTISRTPSGKYFVSVLVDTLKKVPKPVEIKPETAIGIDLGLKSFMVTSEGLKFEHPKHLQKSLSHLKYLSRQHSKKKKGSKNKNKSRIKLALCHEKIANQRKDFLHKLSNNLVKNHDTLCFESLKIENMVRNRRLARSIHSSGWGKFVDMCKYKSIWSGKNILQIPTFEPSTKICSTCGHKTDSLTLADRNWLCVHCFTGHDRDINAAINIKNYSIKNCGMRSRKKAWGAAGHVAGVMNQELPV